MNEKSTNRWWVPGEPWWEEPESKRIARQLEVAQLSGNEAEVMRLSRALAEAQWNEERI